MVHRGGGGIDPTPVPDDRRAATTGGIARSTQQPAHCEPEAMDAEDLLFILYTSGTTGKPKGIVHTTGGYLTQVAATTQYVFDLRDDDVFWCTADIGWVTGHSYVVYGPLAIGATVVMYEGAPDWPERDRFWEICERYGVTVLYTAPTAIRAFMKWGTEHPARHDLSTSAAARQRRASRSIPKRGSGITQHIGGGRCPIVDTWWQTETGGIMITPLPGVVTTKPGSATIPFPGIDAELVDAAGHADAPTAAASSPSPRRGPACCAPSTATTSAISETYWSRFPGRYFAGDGAKLDDDGYWWILGRVDDVLNVAGHRIGTMEVESALVDHPAVAEAAVVGKAHELKGQAHRGVRHAEGGQAAVAGAARRTARARREEDRRASPGRTTSSSAADLPKTRSGKIMRRLLRDIAEGRALGDTTTLADPNVVAKLKEQYEEKE